MFTHSIVALVTPFGKDQKIDYMVLKNLVAMHIAEGTDALMVAGTTGEGPTLDKEELKELLLFVIKEVEGRIPVIAGSGTNCTRKTVEMTKMAKEVGADGALLILPYYNKPSERGVLTHFYELDKLQFPLIPYHHPGRTGIELSLESYVALSDYENVVAIKDCSKNKGLLREFLEKRPEAILLCGDDDLALDRIQMGAKGTISVIGNLFPGLWRKIIHLAVQGDQKGAEALYSEIKGVIWALSLEVNPQTIKCAMAKQGLCEDILRLPMLPVTDDTREEIYEALENKAFDLLISNPRD